MIHLDCVLDVEDFVAMTTPKRYPIFLDDGRRRVNGKSFMEMFSLRLNEPLRVTAQCSNRERREAGIVIPRGNWCEGVR